MKKFSILKKCMTVAVFVLASSNVLAALPPLPQSIREIEAILSNDFLKSDEMTTETIWQIQKTDTGYILETSNFIIPINMIDLPPKNIGPSQFDAQFDIDNLIAKDEQISN